jgi:hypothetical protein
MYVTLFVCRQTFLNIVSDVDQCITDNCLYIPYLIWVISNMVPVLIGSLLVAYVEVKCVLERLVQ